QKCNRLRIGMLGQYMLIAVVQGDHLAANIGVIKQKTLTEIWIVHTGHAKKGSDQRYAMNLINGGISPLGNVNSREKSPRFQADAASGSFVTACRNPIRENTPQTEA